jgi:hypothetical protein
MKRNKLNIAISALALGCALTTTSCSDSFLDETNRSSYTTKYFETEQGIQEAAAALYGNIRWHFGYEWAYGITLYGTDEFTNGNDLTSQPWNTYDNRLQALDCVPENGAANKNCPPVSGLWDEMYYGIANANKIIASGDMISNEDTRNKCVGEAYFLRGYNYYRLFAQYGGVVLSTKPVEGPVRNFNRASEEEVLNQVIADFDKAYEMLPTTKWRGNGSWTKYTAAHFLAKALLYRQSERCSDWNGSYDAKADLDRCIALCDEVIKACPLASNYSNLYNEWTGIDCKAEGQSEILMSCQHTASYAGRYGNRVYSYFNPQISNFSGSWVQRGQYVGLDFQRCRPTEYSYSIFDNVNDSRMWKTFRTVYGLNNVAKTDSAVMADNGVTADQVPTLGDEGIIFILNKKDDHRFDNDAYGSFGNGTSNHTFVNPLTGKWVPNAFPTFLKGEYVQNKYSTATESKSNVFCGVGKFEDGTRTGEKADSHRDVVMARTGETYLIKAEAQVREGNYQEAINTVNVLRRRAEWKNGEDRAFYTDGTMAFSKATGGDADNTTGASSLGKCKNAAGKKLTNLEAFKASFLQHSTYYLSTGIAETTAASDLQIRDYHNLPAEDEAVLAEMGVTGDKERLINFILNERSRELLGEFNRWEELSRTKTLVQRAKLFNPEAKPNVSAKHLLRPIPQKFIDQLQNEDGSNLSKEQQAAWQNPGYVNTDAAAKQ